ncbi:MAG TPA: hypothetical protein VF407_06125, partial [Polyangiaceae bacterium]
MAREGEWLFGDPLRLRDRFEACPFFAEKVEAHLALVFAPYNADRMGLERDVSLHDLDRVDDVLARPHDAKVEIASLSVVLEDAGEISCRACRRFEDFVHGVLSI